MASNKTKANTGAEKAGDKTAKKALAADEQKKASKADESKKKAAAKKNGKPGLVTRIKTYFKGVRSETKRVVWPTKQEMVKYTGAVIGMLIFFGILIALVDAVIVPVLYAFSGLR